MAARSCLPAASPEQANSDLWVMNADGSNPHDITHTPNVIEVMPDWGTHHLTHWALGDARARSVASAAPATLASRLKQTLAISRGVTEKRRVDWRRRVRPR